METNRPIKVSQRLNSLEIGTQDLLHISRAPYPLHHKHRWLDIVSLWHHGSLTTKCSIETVEPQRSKKKFQDWPECDINFLQGKYSIIHPKFCDRFFACQNGVPYLMQCEDGFGYLPFRGCKLLHLVDCTGRPQLQRPRGNAQCPRLYGIFNDPRGCGRFFKCVNGTAVEDRCASSLMFDDVNKFCRDATREEAEACREPALIGCTSDNTNCSWFNCPIADVLPFGDHSRHPYPGNCHRFIMCLKDGSVKVGGCEAGKAYNPVSSTCEPENTVQC
ncbi:uncharacterized protein LOC129000556 [Macrosteles quadrilineatus]|uniref:uncharacterized protein LOC129000556 n=1 Tax=Macrosteles quadrilineatus TaxID=74068 RepID=UPI0023E09251|nr:uncharacterized protein LOC129000556 [Macrosteles quadrilineatus]